MAAVSLAAALAACAPAATDVAPLTAMPSSAPDAPGYVVVGAGHTPRDASKNGDAYPAAITLRFENQQGKSIHLVVANCVKLFDKPCPPLTVAKRRVLQVPPGDWRLSSVSERRHISYGYSDRYETLTIRPRGVVLRVDPGSVTYIGDFIYDFDFGEQRVTLARYERNDAGAAEAVAQYPNLAGRMRYRSPLQPRVAQN